MSLAERLGTLENYEDFARELSPGPGLDRRRKLSYNPLPAKWVAPEEAPPPIAAFEVSTTRRLGTELKLHASLIRWILANGV